MIVAGILLAAIVAWAGWAIWSRYSAPDPKLLVEYNPAGPGRGRMQFGPTQPPRPVDGVRQRNNGYAVRAGDMVMTATKPANKDEWNFNFTSSSTALSTAEQSAALQARMRLVQDAKYAEFLKVTPEQAANLKKVPNRTVLIMPDADRTKLIDLFNKYLAASNKSGPENDLVLALKDAAPRAMETTRSDVAARAKQIQSILTPEQLAPFKQ